MVEVFFDDPEVIGGLVDLQEVGVGSIAEHIACVRRAVSRMHDTGVVSESAERVYTDGDIISDEARLTLWKNKRETLSMQRLHESSRA